ncbi:MAG: hypothetical protein H6590_00775 [Flavobacteriales bacterium]|nr:hypothetical protein [Flavobacteriales bacterium]
MKEHKSQEFFNEPGTGSRAIMSVAWKYLLHVNPQGLKGTMPQYPCQVAFRAWPLSDATVAKQVIQGLGGSLSEEEQLMFEGKDPVYLCGYAEPK